MLDYREPYLRPEYPWHQRKATTHHYTLFKKLAELHEMTHAWLAEMQIDQSTHLMGRGLSHELASNLWLLDSLSGRRIENLLEDAYPEELLKQLGHLVYAVQAWTLRSLINRTPEEGRMILHSVLEQSSWKTGRDFGQRIWPKSSSGHDSRFRDRRSILLAATDLPIYPAFGPDSLLLRRATSQGVEVELLSCAHQLGYPEIRGFEDDLCRLHSHWLRGLLYSLNSQLILEYLPCGPRKRCILRW